jgi:integrase/recombinase XerD
MVDTNLPAEIPQKARNKKHEYSFEQEIHDQLKGFKIYLKELGNGESTIRQKSNYAGYFLQWLEPERLQPQDARYNDLLNFIDYCKSESSSKLINNKLRSIRNFYDYLQKENPGILNPASNLYIRGTRRKVIAGTIDYKTLETLHQSYPTETLRQKRNKVILGLFIYQAITTEELHQLEPNHLKLKEGKICIPGNRRRNGRTLELKSFQILELHEYLTEIRPGIIEEITKPKPARKPDKINKIRLENQLFISVNGSENIKNSLLHMFRDVQKIAPNITNAKQVRQSVIVHWLKNHNLRQAQYMAGHKYVSSTERYQTNNLDNLQSKLEICHPLNGNF